MNKGLKGLESKVLDQGQCAACGACLSLCPYLRSWKGKTVKLHDCDLSEGRCFSFCPRTEVDLDALHRYVFGKGYEDIETGPVRRVVMARALAPGFTQGAQNGGVVSALVDLALEEGVIQAAVVTERDAELLPQGRIVKSREEVLSCAGSSYVTGHTLEALNRGPWQGDERIGVVGLPCHVLALTRMKASHLEKRTPVDRVDLVVGLFCTWALDYRPFAGFLKKRFGDKPIRKLDITPPPERLLHVRLLHVTVDNELHQIPLDEIRAFIRPSCQVCLDMTSELSDLSVGTVEGEEGWNTVIVRTARGEDLLRRAESKGVLETRVYPEDKWSHLKEASILKKRRGLDALKGVQEKYVTLS
ncbi:MAG: coenzyme F420-reducing hydrogenase, beta subunit, partial [Deltaproteobacteria bacterium]|nr:coenzyme F420-reducing hydrogenase, beta subunit [Deltaproteobacteria bacterium]